MPLSEIAQKSLNDSARINAENIATRQRVTTQQEKERKQAENELNAFNTQQAELRQQIETLEQAEREKEARAQKIINDRDLINKTYNDQINNLISQRTIAYSNIPTTKTTVRNIFRFGKWEKITETRPLDRSQRAVLSNTITKNYNSQIDKISRTKRTKLNYFEFNVKYPSVILGGTVRKTFTQSGGRLSLIALYEKQQNAFESKKLRQRAHAISISRSQIKNQRAKFQNIADQFAQDKDEEDKKRKIYFNSKPTKAGDLIEKATPPARVLFQPIPDEIKINLKALKSFQALQESKAKTLKLIMDKRAKVDPIIPRPITNKSNAFLTKAPPTPKSIIKDNKALYTFKQTQAQQKELSKLMAGAKSSREATAIKERFQKLNPYVGTPQTANTKQGKAKQGVLIDLKIPDIFPKAYADDTGKTSQGITTTTTQTTFEIKIGDRVIKINDKETADKLLKKLNQNQQNETTAIPEYQFKDESGNKIKPTTGESFKYMSMLANKTPGVLIPSSKNDNYVNANLDLFDWNPDHANDPRYSGENKNILDIALEDPVNRGILSHLVDPGNTPEGKAIHDILAVGSSTFGNKPLPKKSEVIDFISKKMETDEGKKELLGSAIGSYFAIRIFTEIPVFVGNKFTQYVTAPKTLKVAEEIAKGIRISGRDPTTEKLIQKFPGMPEKMKTQLRNKSNKETVGIEMLDPQTALIKRGTELKEVTTPYIIVKTGKNPHSKLYETFTQEKPGAYKEILISGKQGKELTGGIKQTDDIVSYPVTRDNILKTANSDKLATVGTLEKVGLEGMKETPLAVIKKIETQKVRHGSIILETERLNKLKSLNRDVKGLERGGDNLNIFKPKTTTKPGFTTSTPRIKTDINLTLPGSKPTTGTAKIINPVTQRRESLEKIIRATEKQAPKSDIKILGTTAGISLALGSKTNYIQNAKQGTQQGSKQIQNDTLKIDTQITTKQDVTQSIKTKLETQLTTMQQSKPKLDPKYSLFVNEGLKEKQIQVPILIQDLDQITPQIVSLKTIVTQDTKMPTPFATKTTTTTTRAGLPISLSLGLDKEVKTKVRKGKQKITFFRYNVNTESVGRYIEGVKDLSIGKSRKVITKIDAIERKINKPFYKRKQAKREQKEYEKELTLFNKKKGSFNARGFIPNISTPKGKQAKKQLKKLGFKLNIF